MLSTGFLFVEICIQVRSTSETGSCSVAPADLRVTLSLLFLFSFLNRVSLSSPGCPATCYVDKTGFELRLCPEC